LRYHEQRRGGTPSRSFSPLLSHRRSDRGSTERKRACRFPVPVAIRRRGVGAKQKTVKLSRSTQGASLARPGQRPGTAMGTYASMSEFFSASAPLRGAPVSNSAAPARGHPRQGKTGDGHGPGGEDFHLLRSHPPWGDGEARKTARNKGGPDMELVDAVLSVGLLLIALGLLFTAAR
jgi:hypothetical protein